MQVKMYRCAGEWFSEPSQIPAYFWKAGYLPPLDSGISILKEIAEGKYRPVPSSPKLPKAFSLQDKMPPVYDQASRGTCVAQAATALMEYYADRKWRFSMQYLFERIKRFEKEICVNAKLDNEVTLSSGSNGYMAMEVLVRYGICTYAKWPYSRQLLETNAIVDESRPDMPPGADEEAALHRLPRSYVYVFPAPNNVEEIKRYIAGTDGNRPMPVMIGTRVLDNLAMDGDRIRMPGIKEWKIESAACDATPVWDENGKKSGYFKITRFDESAMQEEDTFQTMDMQMEDGGHEMLIVGYQDDESVPGGGDFIVRNSWHKDWGQEGYCRMPYAFAEMFIDEAATIVQPMKDYMGDGYDGAMPQASASSQKAVPDDLKDYIVKADREQKDRNGRWTIAKGDLIIVDNSGVADRFTEQNALIFRRQGFSWSPAAQAPKEQNSPGEAPACNASRLVLTSEAERFFSGLETAFQKLPLQFPMLGGLRKGWLSRVEKASSFERMADLSNRMGETLKLYDIRGPKTRFRIAAMYIKDALIAAETAGKMRMLLEEYNAQHPFDPAACTIAVIGSNMPIADVVQPLMAENNVRVILDSYTQETGWRVGMESLTGDAAWNEWMVRLVPNTPAQWSEQIERAYEAVAATGGHVTLAKMSREAVLNTELVKTIVEKFVPTLQVKGDQVIKR